jgi:hypothetical protein
VAPVEEYRERITKEEILEFLRPRVAKWQLPDDRDYRLPEVEAKARGL